MTARPILFNGAMVRALLAGTKTQTRRVVKPQPPVEAVAAGVISSNDPSADGLWWWLDHQDFDAASLVSDEFRCPYGVPGDRLWVREAWLTEARNDLVRPRDLSRRARIYYAAGGGDEETIPSCAGHGRPSIHMPRWASRLTLTITDVRVERLHAISEADALAEGISRYTDGFHWEPNPTPSDCRLIGATARKAYLGLWEEINGPESLDANPWVWAVSFSVERSNVDDRLAQDGAH